ncbi:unnamed protein product [Lactuca virosa]|uniref:Uncharacterized protein n=1 Tax=Lactuca virosa TaxID=75947 RepID=A0AAU9PV27_9ASTR|nr:unnamed protein product [Lactuca virosa]
MKLRNLLTQGGDDKEANEGEIVVNEEEVPEANLRNPYQTGKMAKSDAKKKGKVNIISEEDDDLNPNLSEKELKERENLDKELDALNALKAKTEAEEVEEKNVEEILASKKAMFSKLIVDRIQKEAIYNPTLFWLEPQTSFSVKNEMDYQLDFPITVTP